MKSFIFLALIGCAAAADTKSPVEKIVKLLSTMKDQIEADGKHEQQIYDKYACWCEKTSARKADDIVKAQSDLRALGQRILSLKGTVATRSAEIAELTENIKANEESQEEATAVREKQNAAWASSSAETKEALGATQQAITVLSDATIKKGSALLQEAQRTQMKSAVSKVLRTLPSTVPSLPGPRMALLSEFAEATSGYAPQSATIQGMLGDMYLTFANNLQDDTLTEANQNADYEKLYATLEEANNKMKATRKKKETEKAEAEAMLADTTKAYDDTERQMKADEEFFDEVKAACTDKHVEWTKRVEMRRQELEGISKAVEILTGDKARELFAKSIKPGVETFLQIESSPHKTAFLQDGTSASNAAYNALRKQVRKAHSFRLAALAVEVRTAKVGHFDKVIGEIDKMIQTLKDEGAADLAKKTQCLDEYQKIDKTVAKLDWLIKNNEAKIEKLEKLIELRTKEKEETIKKIGDTNQYIKDISAERKEEHEAFQQAKKDDEDAIEVLTMAKDAMAKFYKKNGIKMGPIQGSVKLLQEDPVFEVSEDQAPDATFSSKGSRKMQSKNILSLFAYIIEDLEDEISNGKKAEAQSQADFEKEKEGAEKLVDELTEKKVTLEGIISKRHDQKDEETKTMKNNNKDRDEELSYEAKIKPDCDWILKAFDERATARAAEMDGLTTAKDFLAGQASFIEAPKKFDDNKLAGIGFLGMQ